MIILVASPFAVLSFRAIFILTHVYSCYSIIQRQKSQSTHIDDEVQGGDLSTMGTPVSALSSVLSERNTHANHSISLNPV